MKLSSKYIFFPNFRIIESTSSGLKTTKATISDLVKLDNTKGFNMYSTPNVSKHNNNYMGLKFNIFPTGPEQYFKIQSVSNEQCLALYCQHDLKCFKE